MRTLVLIIIFFSSSIVLAQTSYFVDDKSGDDNNNGTSIKTPFQTIEKIDQLEFKPGDSILFKKGGKWSGTLRPKGNGAKKNRIVTGSYGNGELPIIDGERISGRIMSSGTTGLG